MADLGNYNDKLIQDDEQNQNGISNSITPTAGTSGVVGSGPNAGGVSTAGIGAGGTGGWTNIQAYLNANKTNPDSGSLLNEKAGGQYDKEIGNLQTQAGNTKAQAESQASKINDAKDHSKEWVNQAANAYSWTGNQNSDYNSNVGKLKSAINDQYQGPQNFAYQKSADFQNTGAALGDDNSFSNYMGNIYKDKAGGQLSSGQKALQTQLDVNNQNLADTRQNLLKKYAGFDDTLNKTVGDTDNAIQAAKTQYGNNQAGLRDYLGNMGNDYQEQINKAESDARAGYQNAYTDASKPVFGTNNPGEWQYKNSYKELQDSLARFGGLDSDFVRRAVAGEPLGLEGRYARDAAKAINDFNSAQDAKYANTADNEEKNWNTIMDILGQSDRKQQGFKVRG